MAVNKAWVFKDAQELISAMRTKVNSYGYDIALGGSVVTNGASPNDLDLFFLPKNDNGTPLPVDLLMWLASKFGPGKTIIPAATAPNGAAPANRQYVGPPPAIFTHKMRFDLAGRKIDVFVI